MRAYNPMVVRRVQSLLAFIALMSLAVAGCGDTSLIVQVPNLTNMRYQSAEKYASRNDLKIAPDPNATEKEQYSEYIPEGSIISQDPPSGSFVKTSRLIYVVVSKGKALIEVPSLISKQFGEAQSIILSKGLTLGGIEEQQSNADDVGIVTAQFPAAGTMVDRNTPITVTVSLGFLTTVPKVVGLPTDQAVQVMAQAGFQNITLKPNRSAFALPNVVLRQDPESGLQCDTKNQVDLYYNQP